MNEVDLVRRLFENAKTEALRYVKILNSNFANEQEMLDCLEERKEFRWHEYGSIVEALRYYLQHGLQRQTMGELLQDLEEGLYWLEQRAYHGNR